MATKVEKAVPPAPAKTAAEALKTLGSNRDACLAKADADARLVKQGPNEVPEQRSHRVLRLAQKVWGLSEWRIVDSILTSTTPPHEYQPGTWGPVEADRLIERPGGWAKPFDTRTVS